MTNIYYLAVNLFALTALLLGLSNFNKGAQSWRLLPLFLLVADRALIVILSLSLTTPGGSATIAALEVFSVLCLMWALLKPLPTLPIFWQQVALIGGGLGLLLSLLPLAPDWPVPYQIHSLTIAIFGIPLVLVGLGQVSSLHLATPLTLALAYFAGLVSGPMLFGLGVLLAYGLLIAALHWESNQLYRSKQARSDELTRQVLHKSQERQRLLEVSEILSAVPSLDESMAHITRSMAHFTHSDQALMFVIDIKQPTCFHLWAVYSPERPVSPADYPRQPLTLANFTLLAKAIEQQQQQLIWPQDYPRDLAILYALWYEERLGPTLIQPVMNRGQTVGVLLLANPVTQQPIKEDNQRLCRNLATQIGMLVESSRSYTALAQQVKSAASAETAVETPTTAKNNIGQEQPPTTLADLPAPTEKLVEAHPSKNNSYANTNTVSTSPTETEPTGPATETNSIEHLAILEAVHEGVVVSDAGGRVRLVNKAAEQILGKNRTDLLGQPISSVYGKIASGESIENLAAAFSRRNEPLPTFTHEKNRAIQGQLVPWRSQDKSWMGIIAIFQDVTHQLKADEARDTFVTALSRELKEPLSNIKGSMMTDPAVDKSSPERVRVQQVMQSSVDRIETVLENAVRLGSHFKNRLPPRLEAIDVKDVIEAAVRESGPLAELRQLTLSSQIENGLPQITADRGYLHRILMNLLENACQFTPPGGEITVHARVQQAWQQRATLPELMISVTDTGIGIPMREQTKIFEPFFQGVSGQKVGGMGMGLSVVKELVALHHGRVWVESVANEGATFTVTLPLNQP